MPPRTGPRRKRRVKAAPPLLPRYFTIMRANETIDSVFVLSVELDDGCLVLRNQAGAIEQIVARGEWREIRPGITAADLLPEVVNPAYPAVNSGLTSGTVREPPPDYLTPPAEPDERPVEETDEVAREREHARFVPSSPEEAQRILREIERRLAPDYQDPPDVPDAPTEVTRGPPPPIRKD